MYLKSNSFLCPEYYFRFGFKLLSGCHIPKKLASVLMKLKKNGTTLFLSSHNLTEVEAFCDRVAVIDNSHIVEMGPVKEVFARPKSAIAKELILPKGDSVPNDMSNRCLRVVFDGSSPYEPIVSNMILECHANVNIVYAHTKNIDGKIMGHMVFQLPEDASSAERIKAFLNEKGLIFEEEVLA